MDLLALELVDSGLQFVASDGETSPPSPGLAVIDDSSVLVGNQAARIARIKPRRLHNHFWDTINTKPLKRPFPSHLRTADLIHAHLLEVWSDAAHRADELIFVLPGIYTQEQLGLLLGISDACRMPVKGLVDLAIAAAVDTPAQQHCLHLDLHLHRAVLSTLDLGQTVVRQNVRTNPRVGLQSFMDTWARLAATLFVHSTRFDPLKQATTEQRLYDFLPSVLESLGQVEEAPLTITGGKQKYRIELTREHVLEAVRPAYEQLSAWVKEHTKSESASLLLSARAAALPGLSAMIQENSALDVVALEHSTAGRGALSHASQICLADQTFPFVTSLSRIEKNPPAPVTVTVEPPSGPRPNRTPSHLVVDGVAHRITSEKFVLSTTDTHCCVRHNGNRVVVESSHKGVLLNKQRIEGVAALAAGDRLQLGSQGFEALLVTMAKPESDPPSGVSE